MPVIDVLYEELKQAAPVPVLQSGVAASVLQSEIRLVDVSYTYPGASEPTLKGLALTIRKGESVGFIGPSGAGKSTLVDVILGLLAPDGGLVMVDGQDIQPNLRNWQNQIGYVPQSIYLTDDTIRRNVAIGVPDEQIDDAAILRAIMEAQLEDFVASLPDGFETMVGERGVRLSGGQRQRIGIARALYHDPSVLVLDEATSALDADTENGVMLAIAALQHKKTLVLIAHRLATLKNCTQIVELCDGSIKRIGEYQDVINPCGVSAVEI
jgi:ABC-type multidrug transport system fused ATPase/permease subunit